MNTKNEERELGWDDTIQEDSNIEPIPAGDYDVTVEKFERSRSKGEGKLPPCNMAVVYFIVHTENRDVTIRENYVLHSSLEWKLSELFCGVGLKKKGEEIRMNWQMLPGRKARAKIGVKPGSKDSTRQYNYIDKLYPYTAPGFTPGKF